MWEEERSSSAQLMVWMGTPPTMKRKLRASFGTSRNVRPSKHPISDYFAKIAVLSWHHPTLSLRYVVTIARYIVVSYRSATRSAEQCKIGAVSPVVSCRISRGSIESPILVGIWTSEILLTALLYQAMWDRSIEGRRYEMNGLPNIIRVLSSYNVSRGISLTQTSSLCSGCSHQKRA